MQEANSPTIEGSPESPTPDTNEGSQVAPDQSADITAIISEAVKAATAELGEQVKTLSEQQRSQSSYIGKLEKQLKAPEKPTQDLRPNPLQEQIDNLNEFKQQALAKEDRIKERERVLSLKEAISKSSKMDAGQAERYAKLLIAEEGAKISVSDNDGSFVTNYVQDDNTAPIAISDYIANHFQTDAGRAFLPVKNNPATGNSATGGTIKQGVKRATAADMRNGLVDLGAVSRGEVVIEG